MSYLLSSFLEGRQYNLEQRRDAAAKSGAFHGCKDAHRLGGSPGHPGVLSRQPLRAEAGQAVRQGCICSLRPPGRAQAMIPVFARITPVRPPIVTSLIQHILVTFT